MIAQITLIKKKKSYYGGDLFVVFMKTNKGENVFTYVYKKMRNYSRWSKVLREGVILKNLKLLQGRKNIINADSKFVVIEEK